MFLSLKVVCYDKYNLHKCNNPFGECNNVDTVLVFAYGATAVPPGFIQPESTLKSGWTPQKCNNMCFKLLLTTV